MRTKLKGLDSSDGTARLTLEVNPYDAEPSVEFHQHTRSYWRMFSQKISAQEARRLAHWFSELAGWLEGTRPATPAPPDTF